MDFTGDHVVSTRQLMHAHNIDADGYVSVSHPLKLFYCSAHVHERRWVYKVYKESLVPEDRRGGIEHAFRNEGGRAATFLKDLQFCWSLGQGIGAMLCPCSSTYTVPLKGIL